MKIFRTVQEKLWIRGFVKNQSASHRTKLMKLIIVRSILLLTSYFTYLLHVANTPKEYMDSIFMAGTGLLIFISVVSIVHEMETIFLLIDEAEAAVNERLKNPELILMYERTNRLAEIVSKIIHFIIDDLSVVLFIMPKAIYCYFMYFTTDLDSDAFGLSAPMWLPFNWKNPFGYFIAIVVQMHAVAVPLRFMGCLISFANVAFLFAITFAKDIKVTIRSINENIRGQRSHSFILTKLMATIRCTTIKRILGYYMEIYQVTLTVTFLGCTGAICLAMLMIQLQISHLSDGIDSMMLWGSIFAGFWALALVFSACELSQRLCNAFEEVNDVLGQIDWYELPIEIQKMLLMLMMYVQVPVIVKFFGSISCSREQFKRVINAGYKYFMVLREFYK